MTNEERLAEIDIDGAEKRAEFILAHHASDVCWRSCRTLTEVDVPALIARVRELEAENERLQGFADRLAENGGKALREAARLRGQAARDAKVVEAAKHLSYVMPIAERYVPTRQQVPLRQLRAALAARGEG